ncbi:hypothetical protein K491DRAFT_776172 [Lophiostoma macrostomum CBS 122681]|uniref:Uncharacterized protein n=1 Tax=Lophiostoma macrostomum CBS 122681 TaxID=1314788 RepID=A0A6A6TJ14_9PLEO|nr:hypothetical protein K491DRAFT_776172 [Lophiostoma macrostomum CBS 122681]
MSSDSPASSPSLEYWYPEARVDQSLAQLDLNTLMMRSKARRLPEEVHSSLDESSYEVLGESMSETSDDEGHTESLASTDGQTPDDSGFSDDDDDESGVVVDDLDDSEPHAPALAAHPPAPLEDSRITSPGDSMMTSTAETRGGEASYLGLEESRPMRGDTIEADGVINTYSRASGLPAVLQGYSSQEIRLSVKMALSPRLLPISRSFWILYVGSFPDWGIQDVNRQIGAALNATPSSSRFNIVQDDGFPGSNSSSKVQLERSYSELVVDHCPSPKLSQEVNSARVSLTLDDGSELAVGQDLKPGTARLPDLVIFCHSSARATVNEEVAFSVTRTILQGRVPSLDMSMVRQYDGPAFKSLPTSLRLCIEGRQRQSEGFQTQRTLPVDLYTFLTIDPAHINRHLAFLQETSISTISGRKKHDSGAWTVWNFLPAMLKAPKKSHSKTVSDQPAIPWRRILEFLGVLALSCCITWAIVSQGKTLLSRPATVPEISSAIHKVVPDIIAETPAPKTYHGVSSSVIAKITSSDLATVPSTRKDISHNKPNRGSAKDELFGTFDIETTGEHQFILRTSKQATRGRRKLIPQVHIERGVETVHAKVTRSSDGVYLVELGQDYPLSLFNVTVVAQRKPLLQQSFQVTLGAKKPGMSSLLGDLDRLTQGFVRDVAAAQTNLRNITTNVSKGLYGAISRFEGSALSTIEQTRDWGRHMQEHTQTFTGRLLQSKEEAARQLDKGAHTVKEVSEALQKSWHAYSDKASELVEKIYMPDVWGQARPSVIRARKNALKIQKKLEELQKRAKIDGQVDEAGKDAKGKKHGRGSRKWRQQERGKK